MKIPISRPSLGEEEIDAIRTVFSTGWLGLGSVVFEFEKILEEFLGGRKVIAVNTGTSALHIAMDSLGIGSGDEVIVPSLTFAASVQAVIACRATPVFADIDPETLNVLPEEVEKRITPKTRAIMPVHYGGLPCDMDALLNLAEKYGVRVVEDAAHAFGSTYKDRKIGSFGDITCFSFDPIKNITCGEGGAVVTGDENLADVIRKKRILGIDKDTWHRYKNERSWFYEVNTPGYRYHMSNINAAIGLVQLGKFERFLSRKREIVRRYDAAFTEVEGIQLLTRNYEETAPFCYIIRVAEQTREAFMKYLAENGIGAGVHYIPNHIQPLFKRYYNDLPATDRVWKEIVTLPLYPEMSENEVEKVIEVVKKFFSEKGKKR